MRNQHAGTCYRCGEKCDVGAGHFERITRIQRAKWGPRFYVRWLIQHADCAIKWRGTNRHYLYAPNVEPLPEEKSA